MLTTTLKRFKTPTTPPAVIKLAISKAISLRSSELVSQAASGAITHQEYLAMQFPADAISFLEKFIDAGIVEYEEARNAT
tara:strand:- start:4773 stop:5012 length:240 start_codon:yes stop_codon:yes gene_type:complete